MHATTLVNLKNIQWIKSYPKDYIVYTFFIYMYGVGDGRGGLAFWN